MKFLATLIALALAAVAVNAELNCCPNQGCNLCPQDKQVNCEKV
jgi:hypothetical protein